MVRPSESEALCDWCDWDKGKSTVVELMNTILEASGRSTAVLNSVRRKVGDEDSTNMTGNSMPGHALIQRFLRDAVRAQCSYALVEVTSEGVLQHRHRFIDWDAGTFLNLAPEHLERHGSFGAYRAAKVRFFSDFARSGKRRKYLFVNEQDANHQYFADAARGVPGVTLTYFSRERFVAEELGGRYDLHSLEGRRMVGDWLTADFNLENAAAAVALARVQGIDWDTIRRGLDSFHGVPGRLEYVQKKPFAAIVDYAHTPDSLEKIYSAIEMSVLQETKGHLIGVLGSAAGGRDTWKRPVMGRIAAEHCDSLILTNEDPFDEDPRAIVDAIALGFKDAKSRKLRAGNIEIVLDRREAVRRAIKLAHPGDAVIVTGKGSEPYLHLAGGVRAPWSDRRVVEEALAASGQ